MQVHVRLGRPFPFVTAGKQIQTVSETATIKKRKPRTPSLLLDMTTPITMIQLQYMYSRTQAIKLHVES